MGTMAYPVEQDYEARAGTGTEESRVPAVPERNYHD